MRALALAIAVVACTREHRVELLLGPTPDKPSLGFTCNSSAFGSAETPDSHLQFALVIDVVDFRGRFPSCFADDIVTTCGSGGTGCDLRTDHRTCIDVDVDVSGVAQDGVPAKVAAALKAAAPVEFGATNRPVMVRIVALRPNLPPHAQDDDPCATVGPDSRLADASSFGVLGCAYSCPVVLDDVEAVQVGLATFDNLNDSATCTSVIDVCAGFMAP